MESSSIGFKEFHKYLLLPEENRDTDQAKALFKDGVEQLKLVTRRYARKQVKWIRNRFLKRRGSRVPPVYGVDSSDASLWHTQVHKPASAVVEAYLQEREPTIPCLPVAENPSEPQHNKCEICGGRVLVTTFEWNVHLKSRKHKKIY